MSLKRKISARKIVQVLLTVTLAVVCIVAVMSATKTQQARELNKVYIQLNNNEYGFVTKADVMHMLSANGNVKLHGTKLSQVNVKKMEQVLKNNEWIEDAQVYIDNSHNLHALVTQREPYVRIFEKTGGSYYLDRKAEPMSLSPKYNHYTTVVTNVPNLNDTANKAVKAEIMALVKFIKQDTFWTGQVSQLVVRDDLKFEIVPVLGEHQVILGDTTHMQKKFDNLFTFYKEVLNKVGWDKYQVLDLSYNGQLVASPALAWKLPVDKVINRINWVNSILEEEKAATTPMTSKAVQLAAMNAKMPETKATVVEKKKEVIAPPPAVATKVVNAEAKKPEVKKTEAKKVPEKKAVVTKTAIAKKPEAKKIEARKAAEKKTVVAAKPTPVKKKEIKAKPVTKTKNTKTTKKNTAVKPAKKKEPKKPVKEEEKKQEQKPKYIYNG